MVTMEEYTATLESYGDSLILWADPESRFSGHTKVRRGNNLMML
jgi:hypothetical protein